MLNKICSTSIHRIHLKKQNKLVKLYKVYALFFQSGATVLTNSGNCLSNVNKQTKKSS